MFSENKPGIEYRTMGLTEIENRAVASRGSGAWEKNVVQKA